MRALVLAALLGSLALQSAYAQFGRAWPRQPSIAIVAIEGDPRIALVDEAISYWNGVLEDAGSPFRLPVATRAAVPIPEQPLRELSEAIVSRRRPLEVPQGLRGLPGDLTVILAQGHFISFSGPFDPDGRRVVGIRGMDRPPLSLPNVARNLIAHELGHAIGLWHNADPAMLMCGRPAPCRPDGFASEREHYFPVTEGERQALRRMYPPATAAQ
jgi:hypothetical protein